MKIFWLILLSLTLLFCTQQQPEPTKGNLLIIGGGKRPDYVMKKFVDLAGGPEARIAIIPTASSYYLESGKRYKETFLELGAAEAASFNILTTEIANSDSIAEALKSYDGFFFGGGNQNKLTEFMLGTRALQIIKDAHANGAAIGGTSAGAAIMSDIMITGDGNWEIAVRDSVVTTQGFGFVQNTVIDQHFFARRRFNRLLAVCVQNRVNGLGIDESTAIWVKPDNTMEVIGESIVIALDTQQARWPEKSDSLLTARDLRLGIYKHGDTLP